MLRRRLLAVACLIGVAAGPVVWSVWSKSLRTPGVSVENAYRLRDGMTPEDAQAILGPCAEDSQLPGFRTCRWKRLRKDGKEAVYVYAIFTKGALSHADIMAESANETLIHPNLTISGRLSQLWKKVQKQAGL